MSFVGFPIGRLLCIKQGTRIILIFSAKFIIKAVYTPNNPEGKKGEEEEGEKGKEGMN